MHHIWSSYAQHKNIYRDVSRVFLNRHFNKTNLYIYLHLRLQSTLQKERKGRIDKRVRLFFSSRTNLLLPPLLLLLLSPPPPVGSRAAFSCVSSRSSPVHEFPRHCLRLNRINVRGVQALRIIHNVLEIVHRRCTNGVLIGDPIPYRPESPSTWILFRTLRSTCARSCPTACSLARSNHRESIAPSAPRHARHGAWTVFRERTPVILQIATIRASPYPQIDARFRANRATLYATTSARCEYRSKYIRIRWSQSQSHSDYDFTGRIPPAASSAKDRIPLLVPRSSHTRNVS